MRKAVINMLSLDTTQPSFTKKKLSKRQKRKFANWDEDIMRSILGIQPLWPSSEKALAEMQTLTPQ